MKRTLGAWSVWLTLTSVASAQTPAGGEFRVNTYTSYAQFWPRLAAEPDGDFVVVWMSGVQDGSGLGIFGQRFEASGTARGAEFQVNVDTLGTQRNAAVAVGDNGEFVAVWSSLPD